MHAYSNETASRWRVIGVIAILAVGVEYAASDIVSLVSQKAGFSLATPSVFAIFAALYGAFRLLLWRFGAWFGMLSTADLNGTWKGELRSSYTNFETGYPITLRIDQNWDEIEVQVETEQSRSRSTSASLECSAAETALTYTYQNDPYASAEEDMEAHEGTARLRRVETDELKGQYYTGKGRGRYGEIEVTRQSESWLPF